MATAIGSAAAARGPLGGADGADADADADTLPPPPARPPPPAGAWLNDPSDGFIDPTIFRLPSAPSKSLGYHDVMKGEASALKMFGGEASLGLPKDRIQGGGARARTSIC